MLSRGQVFALILFMSGCGFASAPDRNGAHRIRWTYQAPLEVYYGSPALSADESTVYFGTSSGIYGGLQEGYSFFALDTANGQRLWEYPLGAHMVRSSPAVAADGSIYFLVEGPSTPGLPGSNERLLHLSAQGDSLWAFPTNPGLLPSDVGQSCPAIGPDGTVYIAGDSLYAIQPDGTLKWARYWPLCSEEMRNAPVIGADGTVYFVYHNVPLTALDPADGHTLWKCPLGVNDHCLASPAIAADGTIYANTNQGLVYAVSSSGVLRWTFNIASAGFSGWLRSSPAVDVDGTIYFGLNDGSPSSAFFALNPDGTLKWVWEPSGLPSGVPSDHFDIYSSPAIGADGVIYFGQEFGRVYALAPDGSSLWMVETESAITWCSPALAGDGMLFIADLEGNCYGIQTDSAGLKTGAPWPKFRQNSRNTGRVTP
jgi:outer membrane protein assembly factor BamB